MTLTHPNNIDSIADEHGHVRVLAIDHRDSMRRFLAPDDPLSIPAASITNLKVDIVSALIDLVSGVMLEPEYSIPQITQAGLIPPTVGVIAALEAQGYLDDPSGSITTVMSGWSIEQAQHAGAAMVKLLLPFRPDSPLADEQEAVAARIVLDSARLGIPLVLEPLPWGHDAPEHHAAMIVDIVRRFAALGPALLKVPFPGRGQADPAAAQRACHEIDSACSMPWALLSGGGTFESFEAQLTAAVAAGCSGFMVGRALWGDAAAVAPPERHDVLERVVRPRLTRLNEIVSNGA